MRRRALLSSLASIGAVSVTGCIADEASPGAGGPNTTGRSTTGDGASTTDRTTAGGESTDEGTATEDGTATDDEQADGDTQFDPDDAERHDRVELGLRTSVSFPDNNRPVPVNVWNDADEERSIEVSVSPDGGDAISVGDEVFPPNSYLTVVLNVPMEYTVRLQRQDEVVHELAVDHTDFECNSGFTSLAVHDDWSVDEGGVSTMMACPDPVTSAGSMGVASGGCTDLDEHDATVTYNEGAVEVDGALLTPSPCYAARVAETRYDAETDTFHVAVEASEESGKTCMSCLGEVSYQASYLFERDLPGHVVVTHLVDDEESVVARATWNAGVDLREN
ncbi:hypothetical protein [Haloarchaeobius sp. HRN-SO-5]|uniref:hypothetical protein n=1 Tax=Haloarchaeobius sp. HRN-SO-5 TaxID=3446118 RepID=UPI003EC09849